MKRVLLPVLFLFTFNGCGSSSKPKVDILDYFPAISMIKEYTDVTKKNGDLNREEYTQNVLVERNLITTKQEESMVETVVVTDSEIHLKTNGDTNSTKILKRYLSEGDTLWRYTQQETTKKLMIGSQQIGTETNNLEENCKLEKLIPEYTISFYEYTDFDGEHDIARIKCSANTTVQTTVDPEYVDEVVYENGSVQTKNDIYYLYMQKGFGMVAVINNDCITHLDPITIINDLAPERDCKGEQYHYILYNSHFSVKASVWLLNTPPPHAIQWFSLEEIDQLAISGVDRKALALLKTHLQ